MTEGDPSSSRNPHSSGQPLANNAAPLGATSENSPKDDKDEVEDILHLQREGGVKFLNDLLAKAVPPNSESSKTANVHKWTFQDILKMPSNAQKE
jgi:hypothetical protein